MTLLQSTGETRQLMPAAPVLDSLYSCVPLVGELGHNWARRWEKFQRSAVFTLSDKKGVLVLAVKQSYFHKCMG